MTPRMLSAYDELIMREEVRHDVRAARNARVSGASTRDYQEWENKHGENAK